MNSSRPDMLSRLMRLGDLEIGPEPRVCWVGGYKTQLTMHEYVAGALLIQQPDILARKKDLLSAIRAYTGRDQQGLFLGGFHAKQGTTRLVMIKRLGYYLTDTLHPPQGPVVSEPAAVVRWGPLVMDTKQERLWAGNTEVYLSENEFLLFAYMLQSPDITWRPINLMNLLWPGTYRNRPANGLKHMRVLMGLLRKKLQDYVHIRSVRGEGWRLEPQ